MTDEEALYAGVDGGGSKTLAVVVDATGQERGWGAAAGANVTSHGLDRSIVEVTRPWRRQPRWPDARSRYRRPRLGSPASITRSTIPWSYHVCKDWPTLSISPMTPRSSWARYAAHREWRAMQKRAMRALRLGQSVWRR